jgi:predicted regulator of Ras-like GTPase activity (Roadblock/LC7/MglB family)
MSDLHAGGRSGQLDKVLTDLLSHAPELEAACVVSFDGLPMASALPRAMDEDRVAAMSAALLSLGERAAEGLGRGNLTQVYVEGENGTVYLISADDEAVLVAVAAKGAKAGLMLFEVRRAALALAEVLRAQDAEDDARAAAAEAAEAELALAAHHAAAAAVVAVAAPALAPPAPEPEPAYLPVQANESLEPVPSPAMNGWGSYASVPTSEQQMPW